MIGPARLVGATYFEGLPLSGWILSFYGYRPSQQRADGSWTDTWHAGIDIQPKPANNSPVLCDRGEAEVVEAGIGATGGRVSIFDPHAPPDRCISTFEHMAEVTVTRGQIVKRGDVLGLTGDSHLHYEIGGWSPRYDPLGFIEWWEEEMPYDFALDVPTDLVLPRRVIKYPAARSNVGGRGHYYDRRNEPRALIFHTPEEAADEYEITPDWFRDPQAQAATHYYADNDGDLYQMAADQDCPFAQGVTSSTRQWKGVRGARPPWNPPGISLNCLALSIEVEGFAAGMHRTFSTAQRKTVVEWAALKVQQYDIPIDRDHLCGHSELASHKSDPGTLPLDDIVEAVFQRVQDRPSPPISRNEIAIGVWTGSVIVTPGLVDADGWAHYDLRKRV